MSNNIIIMSQGDLDVFNKTNPFKDQNQVQDKCCDCILFLDGNIQIKPSDLFCTTAIILSGSLTFQIQGNFENKRLQKIYILNESVATSVNKCNSYVYTELKQIVILQYGELSQYFVDKVVYREISSKIQIQTFKQIGQDLHLHKMIEGLYLQQIAQCDKIINKMQDCAAKICDIKNIEQKIRENRSAFLNSSNDIKVTQILNDMTIICKTVNEKPIKQKEIEKTLGPGLFGRAKRLIGRVFTWKVLAIVESAAVVMLSAQLMRK